VKLLEEGVLACCSLGYQMSRDNDPFYCVDEHYPEDAGYRKRNENTSENF
jgi:hypothetical protein